MNLLLNFNNWKYMHYHRHFTHQKSETQKFHGIKIQLQSYIPM